VRKSKWGGLVWESKNRYSHKLYSTLANCATIQKRTPLQGIVPRNFPIFEGMKKFYYRHSAKKCIKYSFDTRAHLKTERRLCFPTSDGLETWLLPSGPTWSPRAGPSLRPFSTGRCQGADQSERSHVHTVAPTTDNATMSGAF